MSLSVNKFLFVLDFDQVLFHRQLTQSAILIIEMECSIWLYSTKFELNFCVNQAENGGMNGLTTHLMEPVLGKLKFDYEDTLKAVVYYWIFDRQTLYKILLSILESNIPPHLNQISQSLHTIHLIFRQLYRPRFLIVQFFSLALFSVMKSSIKNLLQKSLTFSETTRHPSEGPSQILRQLWVPD